jgi:GNAT superfamily N-acetyltransferase
MYEKMNAMNLRVTLDDTIAEEEVVDLYRQNKWSSAEKPSQLLAALRHSHSLVTARDDAKLVGLGNAISDGFLVVYYPHMLVHPEYQRKGIGRKMMKALQSRYAAFHQQILVADGQAIEFYLSLGFKQAGMTQSMWVYAGSEH